MWSISWPLLFLIVLLVVLFSRNVCLILIQQRNRLICHVVRVQFVNCFEVGLLRRLFLFAIRAVGVRRASALIDDRPENRRNVIRRFLAI